MFGLASGVPGPVHSPMVALPLRWEMILALALPQVVLTGANSVLATRDVARRYFGDRAGKVTISALLASIGLGNLASSLVGGLPFCHGSGGMTAHVRGGSYHWSSNLFIGGFLVLMAGAQILLGRTQLIYPPLLLAILLGVVGYYHVLLAAPSWSLKKFRPVLLTMGLVAFVSQNLLWALVGGVLVKGVPYLLSLRKVAA